jgi:hypothetical protein
VIASQASGAALKEGAVCWVPSPSLSGFDQALGGGTTKRRSHKPGETEENKEVIWRRLHTRREPGAYEC